MGLNKAKLIPVVLVCVLWVLAPSIASAMMIAWDRNGEVDVESYSVYACFTLDCVPVIGQEMQQGIVRQTAVGVKPVFDLKDNGREGVVAVTAKDLSRNESGMSVPLPFDLKAPSIPVGLQKQ